MVNRAMIVIVIIEFVVMIGGYFIPKPYHDRFLWTGVGIITLLALGIICLALFETLRKKEE
jgi:hypothetical protein